VKRPEENFKDQLMFTKLVSIGTRGDEKKNPINAPSIQNGALVGAGSLWPFFSSFLLYHPIYDQT